LFIIGVFLVLDRMTKTILCKHLRICLGINVFIYLLHKWIDTWKKHKWLITIVACCNKIMCSVLFFFSCKSLSFSHFGCKNHEFYIKKRHRCCRIICCRFSSHVHFRYNNKYVELLTFLKFITELWLRLWMIIIMR